MAKGYWIGHVDVHGPRRLQGLHGCQYGALSANLAGASSYAAASLRCVEGDVPRAHRGAGIPDYEAALACYRSPEYQAAKKLRDGKSEIDLLIVEGYDGPQP